MSLGAVGYACRLFAMKMFCTVVMALTALPFLFVLLCLVAGIHEMPDALSLQWLAIMFSGALIGRCVLEGQRSAPAGSPAGSPA